MKPPPLQYTNGNYIEPIGKHKYLSPKSFDGDSRMEPLVTNSQQESEPQSNNGGDKEPGSGISEKTATRKRKAATSEVQHESQLKPGERSNKGSGSSSKRQRVGPSEANPNKIAPATQTGLYGSEMFASHAGRHHVICLTVIADLLYIWCYDRQNVIQCSALNFIQDLPLPCVLALQRFENRHWGLNPTVDHTFGKLLTHLTPAIIEDEKEGQVDITLDWSSDERRGHYGLIGQATNMFPVTSQKFASSGELVAKFFWSEVSRVSEPEILKVYEVAEEEPDVRNHVPVMVFHYMFTASSTAAIRSHLGLPIEGARQLILILFEKLMKITKLISDPFLDSWWQTVKCHLALWKNGVYHRDVSVSNLMYKDRAEGPIGVLYDFDLATLAQVPTGNERTTTVPFMALQLLTAEGQAGEIKHIYAHDAESFIWVLLWVCTRYDRGVLRRNTFLDAWLKVDVNGCLEKKALYLLRRNTDIRPGGGHEKNWLVAQQCLDALEAQRPLSKTPSDETCDGPFQKLLAGPYTALCKSDEEEVSHDVKSKETGLLEVA